MGFVEVAVIAVGTQDVGQLVAVVADRLAERLPFHVTIEIDLDDLERLGFERLALTEYANLGLVDECE